MEPSDMQAPAVTGTRFFYPNRMGRVLLQSMEDVIGHSGLLALLKNVGLSHYAEHGFPNNNLDKKFPFEDVSNLMEGIDRMYGPRGGRNIGLRVGQTAFRHGLYEFGPVMGVTDLSVRLLPWSLKLNQGTMALADLFNQFSDQIVRLEDSETILFWHIERCPMCWGRQLSEPRCFFATGLLQEALIWLSGGKNYPVEQTSCRASGAVRCTFSISKKALT